MICSLPFYFFGFYSLRADNGEKILNTYRFFAIGLTKDYDGYRMYLFSEGPHFVNAIVILLFVSLFMMFFYLLICAFRKSTFSEEQYISLSFAFTVLIHSFYSSAVVIGVLFYSNILHASYVLLGRGRLGFSVPIVLILQLIAFFMQYFNWIDYVYAEKRKCKDELESDAAAFEVTRATAARTNIPVQKPANSFYILASKGEYKGGKISLPDNNEIIIGKDPAVASIVISGKYKKVSRKHCGIIRKGYFFYVKDYSLNGTFMSFDGTRMQSGGVLNKVEAGQKFNLANTDNEFYCQIE